MTIQWSCVLAGHGRPITSESSVTPLFIQQPYARDSAFAIVYGCFSRIKKMLGRTEMRTRDRMYCQTIRIRSVRDISRGDRARIATCSLRTSTDRLKANYSIDNDYTPLAGLPGFARDSCSIGPNYVYLCISLLYNLFSFFLCRSWHFSNF